MLPDGEITVAKLLLGSGCAHLFVAEFFCAAALALQINLSRRWPLDPQSAIN